MQPLVMQKPIHNFRRIVECFCQYQINQPYPFFNPICIDLPIIYHSAQNRLQTLKFIKSASTTASRTANTGKHRMAHLKQTPISQSNLWSTSVIYLLYITILMFFFIFRFLYLLFAWNLAANPICPFLPCEEAFARTLFSIGCFWCFLFQSLYQILLHIN